MAEMTIKLLDRTYIKVSTTVKNPRSRVPKPVTGAECMKSAWQDCLTSAGLLGMQSLARYYFPGRQFDWHSSIKPLLLQSYLPLSIPVTGARPHGRSEALCRLGSASCALSAGAGAGPVEAGCFSHLAADSGRGPHSFPSPPHRHAGNESCGLTWRHGTLPAIRAEWRSDEWRFDSFPEFYLFPKRLRVHRGQDRST